MFTYKDTLTISACYIAKDKTIYALVSSTQFALLYRVDLSYEYTRGTSLMFEQIITIRSATSLHEVS